MKDEAHTAHPGFAVSQLQRALLTAASDPDPAVRARAAAKADRWNAVLAGMQQQLVQVGRRVPVRGLPAWVTLEVAHGGFATGRALAEQQVGDDERSELLALGAGADDTVDRASVNTWWLGDTGLTALTDAVGHDRYVAALPEHTALPVVALLLARGQAERALDLVAELEPFLARLRLTPSITASPVRAGQSVHLEDVGAVVDRLAAVTVPEQLRQLHEVLDVWLPLYDDLVALWADTVDDDLPTLAAAGAGQVVQGGWPCARVPTDWAVRREDWLHRFAVAAAAPSPTGEGRSRYLGSTSGFAWLRRALQESSGDGFEALTGRQVGQVRRALAGSVTRLGAPGSPERRAARQAQRQEAARPLVADLARVLARRLGDLDPRAPLAVLDAVAGPATEDELPGLTEPAELPDRLLRAAQRAVEAPVGELVARGVIPSSEVLARVLPQLTARHAAAGFDDAVATELYARTYTAFRRRRSLLLLDLEGQVRLDELPWVAALEGLRTTNPAGEAAALATLREVVLLCLRAFPGTLLPNPLVRELRELTVRAGLQVPLVEEVAADIFMGTFTTKWRDAAAVASDHLAGTLYARYYDLPAAGSWSVVADRRTGWRRLPDRVRWGKETAEDVTDLCRRRAAESGWAQQRWVPAASGTVLEQSQVLTTHNLSALVVALDLHADLRDEAASLARGVLSGLVRSWSRLPRGSYARLLVVKRSAYALRQALLLLSLAPQADQRPVVEELVARVAGSTGSTRALLPVAEGLLHIADGGAFDGAGRAPGGGRRLYGWSVGPHWVLQGL